MSETVEQNAETEQKEVSTERPEFLLDKFKDVDQQAMAYSSAAKKITELSEKIKALESGSPIATDSPDEDADDTAQDTQDEAEQSNEVEDNSENSEELNEVTIAKYSEEYAKNGKLSDESYADLEKLGVSKDDVAGYIAYKTSQTNAVLESVGGVDGWNKIKQWADANLSDDEIAAHDAITKTKNNAAIKMSIQQLAAKYNEANPTAPKKVITGNQKPSGGIQPFKSDAEVTRAMQDPRYATDPDYRADVVKRLRASK